MDTMFLLSVYRAERKEWEYDPYIHDMSNLRLNWPLIFCYGWKHGDMSIFVLNFKMDLYEACISMISFVGQVIHARGVNGPSCVILYITDEII